MQPLPNNMDNNRDGNLPPPQQHAPPPQQFHPHRRDTHAAHINM